MAMINNSHKKKESHFRKLSQKNEEELSQKPLANLYISLFFGGYNEFCTQKHPK